MSNRARSKRLKVLLAANCTLFFCAVTAASVASVIELRSFLQSAYRSEIPPQQAFDDAQRVLDAKYAKLLEDAKAAIEAKDSALKQIREELLTGYVVAKDIYVTDSNRAYWLSEPKLMLGVNSLSGGNLLISFADQTEMISVGERIDFKVDECDCFLLLKSSDFGNASFRYACRPGSSEIRHESRKPIFDARLIQPENVRHP